MKDKGVIAFTAVGSLAALAVMAAPALPGSQAAKDAAKRAAAPVPAPVESKPKYGRTEAIVACEAKLEHSLRDPGSVRYDRNLTAYVYEDNLHKVALVYNAKNGFGGYAGQDIYTCTFK